MDCELDLVMNLDRENRLYQEIDRTGLLLFERGRTVCDVRLFKSAWMDDQAAVQLYQIPFPDEMYLNIVAYHLQQCVEKVLKGALECVGVTVPNTHRISKLLQMVIQNGANLVVTQWLDDHAEMLSEWGAESRYNMDFIVEKRKTDCAIVQIENFLNQNGIRQQLREELKNEQIMEKLLSFLPQNTKRSCSEFDLNCYYIMFAKKIKKQVNTYEPEAGAVKTES